MPKKSKPKKDPAKSNAKPLRGAKLIRHMFAKSGAAFTMDELVTALGHGGKTPRATAAAIMSVLANPAKTPDPLKIVLDRKTGRYSVASTHVAGADSSTDEAPTAVAGVAGAAKKVKKAAAPKRAAA